MNIFSRLLYTPSRGTSVDLSLLLLRMAGGGFMLGHGYGKLQQVLSGNMEFGDPIGLGAETSLLLTVFAEFVCALMVLIGLFTRLATIPIIITMLVAVLLVHAGDEFGNKEAGLFFLVTNLVILLCGAGRYSLDYAMRRKR
ncbi:MAG TPA: DoxX family protein [Flavobacterium sp.]|jgi:putative oxidoreductase